MWLLEERQQGVPGIEAWLKEFVATHYQDVGGDVAMARLQNQNGGSASLPVSELTLGQEVQIQIVGFTRDELNDYLRLRCEGISRKSATWLRKAAEIVWAQTGGEVSREACGKLRTYTLQKYSDIDAKRKVLNFAKAFLKHLGKTRFDARYEMFSVYLEMPKAVKLRKAVTGRIVTFDDVKAVISRINADETLPDRRRVEFKALVLFGAYTGQRPYSTLKTVTVGQLREALAQEKPALCVMAEQDKIRMEHYVPLHPRVVQVMKKLCDGREDNERVFMLESFRKWTQKQKIPLSRCNRHFIASDLRKFAEQHGDVIGWEQSNRAYILTHGVGGVDWGHYKHPLPENVYDVYMKVWGAVEI
jgi:integrase